MDEPIVVSAENAVLALTNCVLSVLNQLEGKEDMKLVLANLSAKNRQLIGEAALKNEYYEICQAVSEVSGS
jgi:hypothetical protein